MRRVLTVLCMFLASVCAWAEWIPIGESTGGDVWYIDSAVENGRYSGQYVVWVKIKPKKEDVVEGRRVAAEKVCYVFRDGCSQYGIIAVHRYDARDMIIDSTDTEYPDWKYPAPGSMGSWIRDLLRERLKTGKWNVYYEPDEVGETSDAGRVAPEGDVK